MKNLLAISKKGIIFISAMLILLAGGLVIGLPSIYSDMGGTTTYTKYVTIPILNNTGQTLTISKMYVRVPDECYSGHMSRLNETRVFEIRFSDDNTFGNADDTVVYSASSGNCCCNRTACYGETQTFTTNYDFSNAKVWCRVTLNREVDTRPAGTYTVTYSYGFPGEATNARSNTETFPL
ncbi:MAG: hypothetical protein KKI12_05265 [Proteobacteria bacterium]|nr:hypothetical protein [Pseudomonadota bacterium]